MQTAGMGLVPLPAGVFLLALFGKPRLDDRFSQTTDRGLAPGRLHAEPGVQILRDVNQLGLLRDFNVRLISGNRFIPHSRISSASS